MTDQEAVALAELKRVREYAALMGALKKLSQVPCEKCSEALCYDVFGNAFCPICEPSQLEPCGICKKPQWRCSC